MAITYKTTPEENFQIKSYTRTIIATGLALFAMFFGAGNIIFPLFLGAHTAQNILPSAIGFLLAGVGVPFLGLYATILYQGDYWAFFQRLGKLPALVIITILMISIGPFGAMPRTVMTTFNTLAPFVTSDLAASKIIFNFVYCLFIFLLAYRETKVVEILGLVLSPIKILSFSTLIILGLVHFEPYTVNAVTELAAFKDGIVQGNNTMDLLAAFFFSSVAYRSITNAATNDPSKRTLTSLTLKSCFVGMFLLSAVYIGFMIVAQHHAFSLQAIPKEQMINAIAKVVLGKFGGVFVGISVTFACIATSLALAEITSHYLHTVIFRQKINKQINLLMVVAITFVFSNFEFATLMQLISPILQSIYPALIVLSVMNILYKWKAINMVKLPVLITFVGTILINILNGSYPLI